MATELKTTSRIGGMGGSTCQNVGTFVHRIPSTNTRGVIQLYNPHNSHNQPDNQRHERPPELKEAASVTMTSYKLDTGVFLQQFTNSVSRALHKQTCTCSGRSYTADELFLRSNPAIFATANVTEACSRQSPGACSRQSPGACSRQSTADSLPSVMSRSGCVGKHKPARDVHVSTTHYSSPKIKLENEFVPRENATHCTRIKTLGDTSPTKRPKRQSNLPERINVTDKHGQNWQIVQNFPKHLKESPSHQSPSWSSQELEFQTPPNTSRLGMSKQDAPERNPPRHRGIHLPKHITGETETTHSSSLEFIQTRDAPSTGPPTADVQGGDVETPQADGFLSSRSMPREADRKFILSLLNSAVRKRQITYEDFLKRASQLTSALSNRDNNDDGMMVENRNQNNNSPSSDVSELKGDGEVGGTEVGGTEAGGTHLPRLNALDNPGEHGPAQQPLPSQLEDLYTRGRLKILKFDIGGVLPDNFLQKGRDELRQMYPMYDWRVGQGARLVKMTRSPAKRVAPNKKESLTTQCTLQLPKMFPKDEGKGSRDKARHSWRDWKGTKRSVGTRGERFAETDKLESAKESKEGEDEAAMEEEEEGEMVGDSEAMEEMRPSSGLMIPRQPPPTPMESRRKQTLEILQEID